VRDDIAILSARVATRANSLGGLGERPSESIGVEKLELGVAASADGGRRAG